MSIKEKIQRNLLLIPGWRTLRKIIVFESDDWGSIRTPNADVLRVLAKANTALENDAMSRFDSLESNDDLIALFEVLNSVKDKNGKPAVITANTIVANPAFDTIGAGNYQQYFYEIFTETLKRYPGREHVKELIMQGIGAGVYKPQFHGREHLNVIQWLTSLQNGNKQLLEAFKYKTFGIPLSETVSMRKNMMSALDYEDKSEMEFQKGIIHEGIDIFEQLFGFRSKSFISTCYIWDSALEKELAQYGVIYMQGIPYQYIPNPDGEWYKRKFHYIGQKNKYNQTYLVRNAHFEPSVMEDSDIVAKCLKRIRLAFNWGKPAIVGSHRVNFIGSIVESNRTENLKLLKKLLECICFEWPDVEFMSTDQLGDIINNDEAKLI